MSYGSELMDEYTIDAEVFYMKACRRLDLLEEEKKLRRCGNHLEGFWTTKDGQKIRFSEMTDRHLNNAIRYFRDLVD